MGCHGVVRLDHEVEIATARGVVKPGAKARNPLARNLPGKSADDLNLLRGQAHDDKGHTLIAR